MKKSRLILGMVGIAGLAAIVATYQCGQRVYEPPHLAKKNELSPAELKYGVAPRHGPNVTYQPDVIFIKGGAESIRSVSDDGLTWTIDSDARGASHLEVGKIMFATGRAVGRVLALRQTAEGLAVTLGPVELTDLVSELSFTVQQPIDLNQAIQYEMPKLPYQPDDVAHNFDASQISLMQASYQVPAVHLQRVKSNVGFFKTWGFAGDNGVGVSGTRDANGVRIDTGFVLALEKPSIDVDVQIHNAHITKAMVTVHGGAKWIAHLDAAGENGVKGNIHEIIPLPVDFSIPITGPAAVAAFPFAVTVRHVFSVKTQFTSQGALSTRGELKLSGEFHTGYDGSHFVSYGPGFTLEKNFVKDMNGITIGAEQMVLAHEVRLIVGVGAWGFVTGPYVGLNTALVARQGSSVGIIVCKGGAIEANLTAGVGYSMPQAVTNAINTILRALNAKPIQGHGGAEAARLKLYHTEDNPTAKPCEEGN